VCGSISQTVSRGFGIEEGSVVKPLPGDKR
jgi:hypothetical protein